MIPVNSKPRFEPFLHKVVVFLSGCECKNSDDEFTPYHGWYCEVHNRVLCADEENPDEEKFYDASKMEKVGDSSWKVCKKCEEIIRNCGECEQNEGEIVN